MPTPTTDFTIFDDQELVVYTPIGDAPVANVPALRRPLTKSSQRNVERYVELHATDVVFHLDGTSLAGTSLAADDALTDSGSQQYQVLFVERQSWNNIVVVVCRPGA
jgi:hypothetical protein